MRILNQPKLRSKLKEEICLLGEAVKFFLHQCPGFNKASMLWAQGLLHLLLFFTFKMGPGHLLLKAFDRNCDALSSPQDLHLDQISSSECSVHENSGGLAPFFKAEGPPEAPEEEMVAGLPSIHDCMLVASLPTEVEGNEVKFYDERTGEALETSEVYKVQRKRQRADEDGKLQREERHHVRRSKG